MKTNYIKILLAIVVVCFVIFGTFFCWYHYEALKQGQNPLNRYSYHVDKYDRIIILDTQKGFVYRQYINTEPFKEGLIPIFYESPSGQYTLEPMTSTKEMVSDLLKAKEQHKPIRLFDLPDQPPKKSTEKEQ